MSDPFDSSYRSIMKAQDHINDLSAKIKAFFESKPHARVVEIHSDGVREAHKIKFIRPIPETFSDIMVDAVYNLRAALDQAGYAVGVLNGKPNPGNASFPFAGSEDQLLKSSVPKHCADLPQEIIDAMVSFKPFKGGNDVLWALNKLCNVNKHRMLSEVGPTFAGLNFDYLEGTGLAVIPNPPTWDNEKNEITYVIFEQRQTLKYELNLTCKIAFIKIEGIQGREVISTLNQMADIVRAIVAKIQVRTFKLGLLKP